MNSISIIRFKVEDACEFGYDLTRIFKFQVEQVSSEVSSTPKVVFVLVDDNEPVQINYVNFSAYFAVRFSLYMLALLFVAVSSDILSIIFVRQMVNRLKAKNDAIKQHQQRTPAAAPQTTTNASRQQASNNPLTAPTVANLPPPALAGV